LFAVGPRLNFPTDRSDTDLVPLSIDHQAVADQVLLRRDPASVSLAIDVARATR
jgi:hypothetical protein